MGASTLGLPAGIPSDSILDLTKEFETGEQGVAEEDYSEHARWVRKEISYAEPHFMLQREHMRKAWEFFDGHQLSDEDLRILRRDKRPDTAINEIQKFIKFASGIERRTQQALLFGARTTEDQQAQTKGELITKQYEWFCDQSRAQFERSLTFESKLVAGLGIVDIGLSRNLDPAGGPRYAFCDASEFLYPECSKENWGLDTPSPIKWIGRETHMAVDEAIRKWPDQAIFIRAAAGGAGDDHWPDSKGGPKNPINYVVPWVQTEPVNKGGQSTGKPGKVAILEWQHYDDEDGYYFFDPIQQDDVWLNTSDFRKLRNRYQALFKAKITDFDKQDHRVFKRSFFLDRRILLQKPTPLTGVTGDVGYTWNVMTGAWDRKEKIRFGILNVFMAPQRWGNAMFRQVLEILGASPKAGMLAEVGAITVGQKQDYQDTGGRPGSVNLVQPGALSGNKVQFKPTPQLPQGTMEVLSFCVDMAEKVSGLSMSLMGADQSNTPGVSLRRRLTSGMVLLAAEFDSLSRFRKREGELIFQFMKLLADDRWIRIGGPYDGKALQLTKGPFGIKYDITLDEIESDPNMRQYYTDQMMQIAPILVRTGHFVPEILDYVNLPVQFRQSLKQSIQAQAQNEQQMAMQGISVGGRGKPRGLDEIKADTMLKQARSFEHVAKGMAQFHKAVNDRNKQQSDNLRGVFDVHHKRQELAQGERQLNLELLGKLFDALKPQGGGAEKR